MVACWSLNFIVGKVGLEHLSPLTLASFRVVLAGIIMAPIYFLLRPRSTPARQRTSPSTRREWRTFALLGVLGVVLNQVCFTVGLNYTTVGHSALIIGMGPILVLLLACAQGLESLTAKKALGVTLAFGGVMVLAAEHDLSLRSGTLLGDLITFTGSFAFALYTVLGKKVAAVYDSVSMNAYNYLAGGILVLPLAVYEALRLGRAGGWAAVGWKGWAALGYMAAFASVLAYLIYFWVLRHMTASRLGALSYLHPVMTTLLGVVLLGEKLSRSLLLGGGLVLAGVALIESGPRENQREANSP